MNRTWLVVLAIVAVLGVIGLMVDPGPSSRAPTPATAAPDPTPSRPATLDPGAYLACRRFAPIARDVDAGLLTNAEFRQGIQSVYDAARSWPDSAVTRASRALLQTLTSGGSSDTLRTRFLALVSACRGWQNRP